MMARCPPSRSSGPAASPSGGYGEAATHCSAPDPLRCSLGPISSGWPTDFHRGFGSPDRLGRALRSDPFGKRAPPGPVLLRSPTGTNTRRRLACRQPLRLHPHAFGHCHRTRNHPSAASHAVRYHGNRFFPAPIQAARRYAWATWCRLQDLRSLRRELDQHSIDWPLQALPPISTPLEWTIPPHRIA